MMVIRPIALKDLDGLMDLARAAGVGLTSLPVNEDRLSKRISRSLLSFSGDLDKADQGYVFVLEDTEAGKVAGICALEAAVGLKEPWYNYRIGNMVHASEELGVYTNHETLYLSNDHTGYAEVCTLFLHPDYRKNRNGAFLSKCRFLFLAQFMHFFGHITVAEMRGFSDEEGESPFWEALGRHFFSLDFARADYLSGVGQKAFIAELMPKNPIYIDFLPQAAKEVIGQTHPNTRPAIAMLQAEGFRYEGYVDIFDAGPTIQAYTKEIRAVRESRVLPVIPADPVPVHENELYLVSNTLLEGFRVILTSIPKPENGVWLTPEQMVKLNVQEGENVRCVALNPREVV